MPNDRDPRLARLREHTEGRTIAASSGDAALTAIAVVITLLLAWAATYLAGGSKTALPHAFYVPVIISAVRFGAPGALIASVAAGVAVGPLMPLDVLAGSPQQAGNWVTRLVTFVLIGQLTAYLSRHSLPSLTEELAGRRFRRDIHLAISEGQLRLVYQPIVDLRSGGIAGVEALIRWDHPTRGLVPPDDFIGQAERQGCINDITRFVLTTACHQIAAWRDSELADVQGFVLSVNVSAVDLDDDALAAHISEVLADTGLPSCWLTLEMTETALVRDVAAAVARLTALRQLGIRLAIDDFGTGESSLAHLHRYPVDVVKIDRVFLARLGDQDRGDVIAASVVALAEALGHVTVAEGIETARQAGLVRGFGCDLGQGYLFARPLPPKELRGILTDPDRFRDANIQAGLHAPFDRISATERG